MRLIKLAFISLVVFFGIITIMSLLIPSHVRISRAINIGSPADSILYLVHDRNQWSRWHPAFQRQNAMALPQHQIKITPVLQTDSVVTMRWQQDGKPPVLNGWHLHRFSAPGSVTLQWYMDFQLRWYPWQKFSSLFYEKTYGAMMEQGLKNIKAITDGN